jgi:hypothetical protein
LHFYSATFHITKRCTQANTKELTVTFVFLIKTRIGRKLKTKEIVSLLMKNEKVNENRKTPPKQKT